MLIREQGHHLMAKTYDVHAEDPVKKDFDVKYYIPAAEEVRVTSIQQETCFKDFSMFHCVLNIYWLYGSIFNLLIYILC